MLFEYRHLESLSLAVIVGGSQDSKQPDIKQSAQFCRNHANDPKGSWSELDR